ncbi:XRE family transcriptional regulator [Kaistia dalseonensis]|uniref:Transcriptional regulator with XRE-family HTH domain n=1 Tax=Kaistia dalseonensis TaxID=410840 RepID=A0ABU0H3J5_9HYPH|nr:XRE family transcriptional regulator [Kaistia dalseonensis]MCX5493486.1 XRE family transcriptional regulator [Kaistia dalseonensis]MDQ0436046.1 transcriptional regulator with XRE-family HTH domain [Kaistia dalseonensis]
MIKNERQLGITQKQARRFEEAIADARHRDAPENTHPIMWKAYIDGMESQLSTLQREIDEYHCLKSGKVDRIEVGSLEGLPLGIIKARIVRGLTHQELADRIGVKAQQVQRWENADYETTGFNNLVKIADALDISILESISFQSNARSSASALSALGIDLKFLQRRIVPDAGPKPHEIIAAASKYLQNIWNIVVRPDGSIDSNNFNYAAVDIARYKLPKDANPVRVRAYTQYAYHVAERVSSVIDTESVPVPRDWKQMRDFLCERGELTLQSALDKVWGMGIAVIPLSDPIRFHGCCWRINDRNVIVLKQSVRSESRWLFDLVHELYHAGDEARSDFEAISIDGSDPDRRESEEELAANEFAGNVLLGGNAKELYREAVERANGSVASLKQTVRQVAGQHKMDLGILANYVAYSLKADRGVDWWGAATNLQPESEDAYSITASAFHRHFDTSRLATEDRLLVKLATVEPLS